MIVSSDVGSIPPKVRASTLRDGARKSQTLLPLLLVDSDSTSTLTFEEEVTRAFVNKLRSGIDVRARIFGPVTRSNCLEEFFAE